jgi:hypothetical protein
MRLEVRRCRDPDCGTRNQFSALSLRTSPSTVISKEAQLPFHVAPQTHFDFDFLFASQKSVWGLLLLGSQNTSWIIYVTIPILRTCIHSTQTVYLTRIAPVPTVNENWVIKWILPGFKFGIPQAVLGPSLSLFSFVLCPCPLRRNNFCSLCTSTTYCGGPEGSIPATHRIHS